MKLTNLFKFLYVFIPLIIFSKKSMGQCFINTTSTKYGNIYTSRPVVIYRAREERSFDVTVFVDKICVPKDNPKYTIVFVPSGYIKSFFVPDIAEITTLSKKKISLYIAEHGQLIQLGDYYKIEVWEKLENSNENLKTLMNEGIKEIILRDNNNYLKIKINDSNVLIDIFNCLNTKSE